MQTFIYSETGSIIMSTSQTGYGKISSVEAEIPNGYYPKSVNPETGELILEKIEETVEEKQQKEIDALKEQVAALQAAATQQQQITDTIIGATESEETA